MTTSRGGEETSGNAPMLARELHCGGLVSVAGYISGNAGRVAANTV